MNFTQEKHLAYCGLACVLCSEDACPGCKARGCAQGCDCSVYRCCARRGIDGCYACADFPCDEKMLSGVRNRAFNRYAREHGKLALLERLRKNFDDGIVYHRPGGLKGDYDLCDDEDAVLQRLHYGVRDPYWKCPKLATERFLLRLVAQEDAADLLRCYADPNARPLFHAEGCTSDFRYDTLEQMRGCVGFWLGNYQRREFVRWAIVDRQTDAAVGTIEMFGKVGLYQTERGILRLDIASPYEEGSALRELFSLCTHEFFGMFDVSLIVTKAIPAAGARIAVLRELGFAPYESPDRECCWAARRIALE